MNRARSHGRVLTGIPGRNIQETCHESCKILSWDVAGNSVSKCIGIMQDLKLVSWKISQEFFY